MIAYEYSLTLSSNAISRKPMDYIIGFRFSEAGRKEVFQVTIHDYLELEGLGMMTRALRAFGQNSGCSLRYEWKKARKKAEEVYLLKTANGDIDTFHWEYMIYRIHTAGNMVRDREGMDPSYKNSILKGLNNLTEDMPMYLKTIALKKALNGCFLTLGRSSDILTKEHVLTRLNELRAMEMKYSGNPVRACVADVARASDMEVTDRLLDYFEEETNGFAADIAARLTELTPERVSQEADAEDDFKGSNSSDMYA